MVLIGGGENCLPLLLSLVDEVEVQGGRSVQVDAGMAMFVVVPGEEPQAEGPGIPDRTEALRKFGAVLHRAELALRERVGVRDVRA